MRTRHQKLLPTFKVEDLRAAKVSSVSQEGLPSMFSVAVETSDLDGSVSARAEAGGIGSTQVRHLRQLAAKHQETSHLQCFMR